MVSVDAALDSPWQIANPLAEPTFLFQSDRSLDFDKRNRSDLTDPVHSCISFHHLALGALQHRRSS